MADAETEGAGGETSPADKAIDQFREVAKWLIVAFGAIGTTLVAGSQLSEMGELDGGRLFAAFAGLGLGLVGIVIAIWLAAKVLTPQYVTLAGLAANEAKHPAGGLVREEPGVLLGHGDTIGDLKAKRDAKTGAEAQAWARYKADRTDANRDAFESAASELKLVDDAVQQFLPLARFAEVRAGFKRTLVGMVAGALIAAGGIALFAWAAHPEDEAEEPAAAAVKDPTEVVIALNADGRRALRQRLGENCPTNALAAVAVGGEPAALDVVTTPSENCDAERFTMTNEFGTVTGGEEVEALPACPRTNPRPPCVVR